ncbi:MAG: asparagine synthase (glutamine-hydrolyzing) [Moraxellaceae bacterium]|nr:MAG: asparagine synthase (glutamine-hydrolyzing) [Moraxellaceae bacterium]
MFSSDGSIGVVFNGEIFNHIELRHQLAALGYQFKTSHSDTEVLVYLYQHYGDEFLHHINGFFGMALWDRPKQKLLLARDRAGIKPLFYTQNNQQVIFGSEIKAIFKHPAVSKTPNFKALHHYFSFKNVPAPMTAFEGIEQLRPGEMAVFESGDLKTKRWWQLDFNENPDITETEASSHIRDLLEDSVRLRMRSDVPVGAYLSGGVDSSAVVALMSQQGEGNVKTFSLVYDENFANKNADRKFARQMAEIFETEHFEYTLGHQEVLDSIDAVTDAFDEPFSGVTSTYFLTRLIAKEVKVALSGDGADELFASYLPHRLAQPMHHYAEVRPRRDSLTPQELELLTPFDKDLSKLEELTQLGGEAEWRMALYLQDDESKALMYSAKMRDHVGSTSTQSLIKDVLKRTKTKDPLNRILQLDFETMLADQVLPFVDRLSMAHSVEVRPPFLDYRLMEFSATLPGWMKIKNGRVKSILKDALQGLLPDEILARPKEGFVLPINDWLILNYKDYVLDLLSPSRLKKHDLFDSQVIQQFIDSHYDRSKNYGPRLWNLMMFQLWWEKHFD